MTHNYAFLSSGVYQICFYRLPVCVLCLLLCASQVCGVPDSVPSAGSVLGKMTVYQMERSSTVLQEKGKLATRIPTIMTFQLSDRQRYLREAKFTYSWDLGNGQVIVSPEPVIQCSYTSSGNFTFKLIVEANLTRTVRFTGLFSMDLAVLDAISNIELSGPLSYSVDQNASLSFLIDGSLPAWLCWRVSSDGRLPGPPSCNAVRLYENKFQLIYTFRSVGTYWLNLVAENNVSKLEISYSIYVQRNSLSHLIFILLCASLIIASIIFITISVCRPRHDPLSKPRAHGTGKNYLSFADTGYQAGEADTSDSPPPLIFLENKRNGGSSSSSDLLELHTPCAFTSGVE